VLALSPHHPDALANLANIHYQRQDYSAAAQTYQRAFAIRRDMPAGVWVRRALAQRGSGDMTGAEDSLREAARIAPDDIDVQINLASACAERRRWTSAEAPLLRALTLDPANPYALSMLAHARQHRCDWAGLDELFAAINRQLENGDATLRHPANPFPVLAMPTSARAQLHAAQRWARGFAPSPALPRPDVTVANGERLRIGFVSSDLREHPMAHLQVEHWERIDRTRLETFAYGLRAPDQGPIGARVAQAFEHLADVSRESTAQIHRRIRCDGIAILFDLNGYTAGGSTRLLAQRPAPIQINSIGFPGTLGADWYDYILVDRFGAPQAMQAFYTERLWHMPHASYPSDTTRGPHRPSPSRESWGLPADGLVFCCFNKAYKILPDVFAIWMRLLRSIPNSTLWLLESGPDAAQNLLQAARLAGVDPTRLQFAAHVPVDEHLARHAVADLFLDTFPYGAHTTTNDALLAGLPVLTCAGETLVSRLAGSQLHAIGLPELVTASLAEYEALALRLAREPHTLAALRARLAANRHTHPLFDMARYTQDFEALLLHTWDERHRLAP
jgi:predicted O-linked N-acetylglucosamine transferase (SPINDLY family)